MRITVTAHLLNGEDKQVFIEAANPGAVKGDAIMKALQEQHSIENARVTGWVAKPSGKDG